MLIKTREATGPVLDYLVSVAQGYTLDIPAGPNTQLYMVWQGPGDLLAFPIWKEDHTRRYSTDWTRGGPIIDKERIKVAPNLGGSWHGQIRHEKMHALVGREVLAGWTNQHGPTPLVAAMRCYVAAKLGGEVEVPDLLI